MSRGVIGISVLQALLAGVGLMVAGVPQASLIAFAVLILGIIQIGPSIIFDSRYYLELDRDGNDIRGVVHGLHDTSQSAR